MIIDIVFICPSVHGTNIHVIQVSKSYTELCIAGPANETVAHIQLTEPLYFGGTEYSHIAVNPRTLRYIIDCAEGKFSPVLNTTYHVTYG